MKKKKLLSQTWQNLQKSFSVEETVKTTTETGKAVLEAAKTLNEQSASLEILKPVLQQSSSLLDVLCSPLAQVIGSGLPFVSLAIGLLKVAHEITKQEPSLEECVAIVSQAAYLESFNEIISEHQNILANWNSKSNQEAIKKELKKLDDFELDTEAVEKVIISFSDSPLTKEFNKIFSHVLQQACLPINEAEDFVKLVARNSQRYFFRAMSEAGNIVKPLSELYSSGGVEILKRYDSIRQYLEVQIAAKPNEKVFNEDFSFADIYIKPKARKVDDNGKVDKNSEVFDLETWAINIILDKDYTKQDKVIFIQGGPGRGKSVFCRMFADLVRRDIYRRWVPILIRLRDIEEFQLSLKETLRTRINAYFAESNLAWLNDDNVKFLFILDGFDELRIERSNDITVRQFIRQIGSFQYDYANKHRVIITGREMALHGIYDLPDNLDRVEIAEMDSDMQKLWFDRWRKLFPNENSTEFQEFLQNDNNCPKAVQNLAREPLLLYMLAAMHRDDRLDTSKFEKATATKAKISIYEQALEWVLKKQRADKRYPKLNEELTKLNPEVLRRLLAEAAMCVVQSGGESASMQMLKARLEEDTEVRDLIYKAEAQLGQEVLKNALSAFYLKPNMSGGVEFFHKSFQEFLCAVRLKQSLEEWTEAGRRGKSFYVDDKQLHEQIYDLLGYGGLTPEIVEYLLGLLKESNEFRPIELFKRLEDFYQRWCSGEFINAPPENLPQKKMRLLREQGISLGLPQVDIYTGFNVIILLSKLHSYAQENNDLKNKITFYPCGQENTEDFDPYRLLRIIGYGQYLGGMTFRKIVGTFLSHIHLVKSYLSRTDFTYADLSYGNLQGVIFRGADFKATCCKEANLTGADFRLANLNGADLIGTNLCSANLSGANLCGADLTNANLTDARLSGTNLCGANLSGANLCGADLTNANLTDARLSGTILENAKLTNANLTNAYLGFSDFGDWFLDSAKLSGANLCGANFSGADFWSQSSGSDLKNISWDEYTNWENVTGLEVADNVPEALKKKLGLS